MMGLASDNCLDYNAGPIRIKIDGHAKVITLTPTTPQWAPCLEDILPAAMDAWEFNESHILKKTSSEIVIQYDLEIVSNYIEFSIIFF